eukprot:3823892-Prymnesium_polylepis.1
MASSPLTGAEAVRALPQPVVFSLLDRSGEALRAEAVATRRAHVRGSAQADRALGVDHLVRGYF